MRVVVRRDECHYCTAINVFCESLPDPYKGTCKTMGETLASGGKAAEEAFMALLEEAGPDVTGKARQDMLEYLRSVGVVKN